MMSHHHLSADVGDIGLYREAVGGADVDEDNQTFHDEPFDTIIYEDTTEFTQDSGDVLVDLKSGGHYFVWWNMHLQATVGSANNRTAHIGRLTVDGSFIHQSFGQGYQRAAGSEQEVYMSGGALIDVSAGADIKLEVRNASSTTVQDVERRANLAGMSMVKLDDDWKYFRAYEAGAAQDWNAGQNVWSGFTWDSIEEIDDIYTFTAGTSNVTLGSIGHYLVTYNMRFDTGTSTQRTVMEGRVQVGGVLQEECHSGTYMRGNPNSDGINEGAVAGVCLIETSSPNQDLIIQTARTGDVGDTVDHVPDECGITIVKLPDNAEYLRIHKNTRSQNVDVIDQTITWDAQDETDSAFTHSVVTNTGSIEINSDGNYLFMACTHGEKPANADSRYPYIEQWKINDVTQKYGAGGAYNRGGHGSGNTQTANDSANCTAVIFEGLTSGDDIELAVTDEGGITGNNPPEYVNDQTGLTAIYLDSLFTNVEGSTDLPNGTILGLAINGTLMKAYSEVSGTSFSIPVGRDHLSSGDIVTVFGSLATDANEAVGITKYDGVGDITGMSVKKHQLTIGSAENPGLILSDLSLFDNNLTEDVMHMVIDGSLVIDADDVYVDDIFVIATGSSFTATSTEAIFTHDLDLNGDLIMSGNNLVHVDGSWDATGGSFSGANSTVVFIGTANETIRSAGDAFNNIMINDGLIGYWRLDEAVSPSQDTSGYGMDGVWAGNVSANASVPNVNFANSQSASFDGTGDYIDVGRSRVMNNLSNGFTVAAWINHDTLSGVDRIFSADRTQSANGWAFGTNGSGLRFTTYGVLDYNTTTITLTTGTWYHVAVVFDASNDATFYVNGNAQTQTISGASPAVANTDDNWYIGADPGSEEFDGLIDDLRIYNRELSSAEIIRLANGDTPQLALGTYSLQDALDVKGTLSLHGGTLDVNGFDINLNGNWLNTGGVLDEETRTVTLDGGDQSIDYTESFFNLNKSVTTTGTLTMGKDSTITVAGALSLSGASGNLLGVESSAAGTRHTWNVTAADQNVSFLRVRDSQTLSNDIVATFSTDVSNNDSGEGSPSWIFASTFYWVNTLGGDTNDSSNWASAANACGVGGGAGVPGPTDVATFQANCDDDATVDVNLNVAALDIQSGYSGTITPNPSVTIDVDGPFTQADGTIDFSVNNTNLNVSGNFTKTGGTFTAGTGVVTFDGSQSISMNAGTNIGDVRVSESPDITLTLESDVVVNDLVIGAGDTVLTDGYDININGTLDINGIMNATNGSGGNTTVHVSGNWDATDGSFINANSTIRFNGTTGTSDIISDGKTFYNLIIDDAGGTLTVELEDDLAVSGTMTIAGGNLDVKSTENNTIRLAGSWDNNDVFTPRSGEVVLNGTGEQTIAHNAGSFNHIRVTNADGIVTFSEAFTTTDFTNTTGGSRLRFQQGATFTISGDLTVDGTVGNLIDINSVNDATQFNFNITGSGNESVSYVMVENSAVTNGSGNDILATKSINANGNDDGDVPPTDQWIFLLGEPDYMQPDVGLPGMNLVVQFVGANFRSDSVVTTSSANIVVGTTVVTDANGNRVSTGGRVISASFFILPSAVAETVTVTIDGVDVAQKFEILSSVTSGDCDFTGDSGTITLGDGAADHGNRTKMGVILCDELIVPSGLTVNIDTTDSDGTTEGNQGYLPAVIIVDGTARIDGEINVDGSAGVANAGDAGGAGGNGGPGGGGGGAGGGQAATQNAGGDGFTGGGGGSCDANNSACTEGDGGDGSGGTGTSKIGNTGGTGGIALVPSTKGGPGGTGDTADGAGGNGGTGFAFGSSGTGASDPSTSGVGGTGSGAGAFNVNGGGGGFAEAGGDGETGTGGSVTGNAQLVPFAGGSGGGGGGAEAQGGGGGGGAGGALIIMATGTITVDGVLSADGGAGAVGTNGDGGGGSGGSIILQSPDVRTSVGQWDTDGGTGTAAGGDGRIRVDGVPAGGASIQGTVSDAGTSQFVGPAITTITGTQVIGTAAASASIDVHITNGVTSSTTTGSADANGDYAIGVTYLSGANYITVVQDTGSNVEVMSTAALGVLSTNISGTSDLSNGTSVRCAQNGGVLAQTTTINSGAFTLADVSKPDTDDVITCWADGVAEADESTAVTKYDGSGDITGLVLNRHKVIVGSDDNANVSITDLAQFDQDNDEDVMYTSNSNVLLLDPAGSDYADEELRILVNNTLTVSAVQTLTTHDLDIDGTLSLVGAASVNISGDLDATGAGTFTEGASNITFNGTADQMVLPDGDNFYNFTVNNTGGAGVNDVILTGTLDVDNDLTITDGDLDQGTNNAWIMIYGDLTAGGNAELTTGTSTVTFDGSVTNQNVSASSITLYDVMINNSTAPPDNRIIVAGTLNAAGDILVTDGRIDLDLSDGNIEVSGDFSVQAAGGVVGGSTTETIVFEGSTDQQFTTNAQTFRNIRVNNIGVAGVSDSVVLTDELDINGTLSIVDGDIDARTNAANINIAGNWVMGVSGTFDAGTETVTFDGDDQLISGSTVFYNLSKTEVSNDGADTDFTIEAGTTQTVLGVLTLDGLDANDRINLDSTGASFFFDVASSQSVSFLVVQNSETLTSDITATTSVDNGGTDSGAASPHWIFSQARYWVGATNPANTNLASSWAAVSGACGTGGIGIPTTTSDVIFDGGCTNNATVDANLNVASMDIQAGFAGVITTNAGIIIDVDGNYTQVTGTVDLATNGGELVVGGNFLKTGGVILNSTGTITLDGLSSLDMDSGSSLGNVVINPPGSGTVTLESDVVIERLTISAGDLLDVNGYEMNITDDVTISGTLDLNSGADGISTISVAGGWLTSGGVFTHGDARITFTSAGSEMIRSNGSAFNDITFNGVGPWILQDNMDLNDGLKLLAGTLDANVSGNYTININGDWQETAGVFLPRQGTVIFDQASGTQSISADVSFYNFVIDDPDNGSDLTVLPAGTLDIDGTLLLTDSTLDLATNNVPMFVAGNFTLNGGAFLPPLTTITFDGDKIFTDNIVTNVGTILIDPTTTLGSDFTCTGLTIDAGDTLITDGYEIDCSANIRVNGTLDAREGIDGTTTINIGKNWRSQSGLLIMGRSTVIMDEDSGIRVFRTGDSNTFYNLTFDDIDGGGDTTWELRDNINIWGTLQILDGTVDARSGVNEPIEVRGNWNSTGGTFIPRQGTVTFAGSNYQTVTVDDDTFYDVVINGGSASTVEFIGSTTFNNFTATVASTSLIFEASRTYQIDGLLNLNGQSKNTRIRLDSSDGANRFEFDVTTEQTVSYVDVSNSEASINDINALISKDRANTDSGDAPATAQWIFPGPLKGATIIVD